MWFGGRHTSEVPILPETAAMNDALNNVGGRLATFRRCIHCNVGLGWLFDRSCAFVRSTQDSGPMWGCLVLT